MSMLDAVNRAAIEAAQQRAAQEARRDQQEAAQATLALRRQIGPGDPPAGATVPPRPTKRGPLAFANAAVRDAAMSGANVGPAEGVQGGGEIARPMMPANAGKGVSADPGRAGSPGAGHLRSLEPAILESRIADALDQIDDPLAQYRELASKPKWGRASRAHARNDDSTPARAGDHSHTNDHSQIRDPVVANDSQQASEHYACALADPVLEKLANDLVDLDAKECWGPLLKRLKALYPPAEAVAARTRVWSRRRDLVAQKKRAAKVAAQLRKLEGAG